MKTTIVKRIEGRVMELLFDDTSLINVRYFKATDLEDEVDYDPQEYYTYEIKIRHPEDENAENILSQAINEVESNL